MRFLKNICLLPFLLAFNANAQTVPDAGALRQLIEQGSKPAFPAPALPPRVAPAPLKKLTGATVLVKAFRFSGNTLISSADLQAVVAPYLNRSLDFAQLQDVAVAVGNAYRAAGWVVRAYLPEQEIENGIVTIEVVEAVFGGSRFEGRESARLANSAIQKYMDATQKIGAPLKAAAVDRALLLLSDMPGVAVTGNLREGESAGQTDVVFDVEDKRLLTAEALLDNTGSRSTGAERFSGNLSLNSPLGLGDQVGANLMFTKGSSYGRLACSMPVGSNGWRVGVNGSYMTYRLVASELVALKALGSSSTLGFDASYPILRSRLQNLYLAINYDHKYFNNEANQTTTTRYLVDVLSLGLNYNLTDNFLGGGVSSFGLTWVHGTVDLSGSPNRAADAATTRTDGAFDKIRFSLNRQQALTEMLSAYAAISGQASGKNLDSGEKFSLGGASGVHAYPSGEGTGADGQLLSLELRARLPHGAGLTGFYDYGHVTVNHDNGFAGAPLLNNYALQGYGVSLGWTAGFGLGLKATLARRIGNNPNPTAAGYDQDGTLYKNRLWLQASMQL